MESVTIAAAGDALSRKRSGYRGDPFEDVGSAFQGADLRFLNLESVLTEETAPMAKKQVCIRTDPSQAAYLEWLGIDVVNLANNHSLDFGEQGLGDTMATLRRSGVGFVGAGFSERDAHRAFTVECYGLKVAVAGYFDYRLRCGEARVAHFEGRSGQVRAEVGELSRSNDIVIVSLHWGVEHVVHPSPAQIEFARSLVDAGAALVLGHHPHCVQGVERYGRGLIAYSLGCFNFWMMGHVKTRWFNRLSFVLMVRLGKSSVLSHRLVPIWVAEDSAPRLIPESPSKAQAENYFRVLNDDLGKTSWDDWYEEVGWMNVPIVLKSFSHTIPKFGLPRLKKLLWWLRWAQTRSALKSLVKATLKGRRPAHYRPKEVDCAHLFHDLQRIRGAVRQDSSQRHRELEASPPECRDTRHRRGGGR